MLNIRWHSCIHLREEKAQDTLTILPVQVVKINLFSIIGFVSRVAASLRQTSRVLLLTRLLLHLALFEPVLSLRLEVDWLSGVRLTVESSRFSFCRNLLPYFFLYLFESLQEELFHVTSLVKDHLTESLNFPQICILASHDLSQIY